MNLENYYNWLTIAQKFSRTQNDAEDLLQDCLLIAFKADKMDFSIEKNRKWFTGVLRNQAAMTARSEGRRKAREEKTATPVETVSSAETETTPSTQAEVQLLIELPPSARVTLKLILAGLNRDEVCSLLKISSSALRQRLAVIRKALKKLPEDLQREALALAYQRKAERADDLAFGLIRRALHRVLKEGAGVGAHDPDGHLFIINSE